MDGSDGAASYEEKTMARTTTKTERCYHEGTPCFIERPARFRDGTEECLCSCPDCSAAKSAARAAERAVREAARAVQYAAQLAKADAARAALTPEQIRIEREGAAWSDEQDRKAGKEARSYHYDPELARHQAGDDALDEGD